MVIFTESESSVDKGKPRAATSSPGSQLKPRRRTVLVACPFDDGSFELSVASWWVAAWAARGKDNDIRLPMLVLDRQPTHWMPLPDPPAP
ncbi:DUF551 domain-containing protein [Mesorhizobium sp. BAC0120]|uniref:DUF551 domain-containing protein n=1 Tax=Mesorhizobium sp. BAC0120 TaxID=3090670 RepID=UPI00399B3F25